LLSDQSHNEMLFIIQHQTTELWMRLVIHEISHIRQTLSTNDLPSAIKTFARVNKIVEQMNSSWDVLRTLTPTDYTEFRDILGSASGLQSQQYRLIEFMLGNRSKNHHSPELDKERTRLSLYDEALHLLNRNDIDIPTVVLERDLSKTYNAHPDVVLAWKVVYEEYPDFSELAEKLIELEDRFRSWKFNHVSTVERVIGFKRGTGGTKGVAYLKKMVDNISFPELWQVRTVL
jgi:tryptophan 2,3-dioxygenase